MVACAVIGFCIELYSMLSQPDHPKRDMQHMTMYFFFGMAAVIKILMHKQFFLPPDVDYASFTMAFLIELILFKFHVHGRDPLDVQVHQLLVFAIGVNALFVILESCNRTHFTINLARHWSMMVHGTWFIQVGFILYNPLPGAVKWDNYDKKQLGLPVFIYSLHCLASFVGITLICLTFAFFNRKNTPIEYGTVRTDELEDWN